MRWIAFIARVAFICNLFFLLSIGLQWKAIALNEAVASTVLITGLLLAVFVANPLANLLYLVFLLRGQALPAIPKWLAWANFVFLLVQVFFVLFFLNDVFHS